MRTLPNWKTHKTCLKCGTCAYGQIDKYCPQCGTELSDKDDWLAGISDYAKSLLIVFFEDHPDIATTIPLRQIPAIATENINNTGSVLFDTWATRMVLAQNWNEVEAAVDDWEKTQCNFGWKGIEALHVFAVTQHAEMVWRKVLEAIDHYWDCEYLSNDELEYAIRQLKEM
jgi:hypothetical protein